VEKSPVGPREERRPQPGDEACADGCERRVERETVKVVRTLARDKSPARGGSTRTVFEMKYHRRFLANGRAIRLTTDVARSPRWRADSWEFFYQAADGGIRAIRCRPAATVRLRRPPRTEGDQSWRSRAPMLCALVHDWGHWVTLYRVTR